MSVIEPIEPFVGQPSFTLERFFGCGPRFDLIRSFRAACDYDFTEEKIDQFAHHYYVEVAGQLVFTVRILHWDECPIDVESVVPFKPQPEDRPHMATASVFLSKAGFARTLAYTRQVWVHEVAHGIRADLIVARKPLVNYYRRLGYRPFRDCVVSHPRTGRECVPMALVCDSDLKGSYAVVCAHADSGELGKKIKPMLV